jgi:predicted MPP superfamily phosphohydrolase
MGVLIGANAMFACAASRFVSVGLASALGCVAYLVTMPRFMAQMRDEPRPRWVTRWVDEPLFVHFGASMFALLASPLAVLGALLAALLVGAGVLPTWRLIVGYTYAFGLALSVWAIWVERRWVRIREVSVSVVDLPAAFEGYRIAQLSDLHVGSFDPKSRALSWVQLSNALEPDLTVVTGDLVTSGSGFYRDVAEALAELRAKDGVFVSMGNHDQSNNEQLTALITERGPRVLRNSSAVVRRGDALLGIAGIDGKITSFNEVRRTITGCPPGAPVVVLSHYPWTFDAAVAAGADLVLAGHTHGGQLGIPFFAQRLNLARLSGQRSRGLVISGKTAMYVNAGLGTTGPPMRLGIPPEIALITLRKA